jgi:hypothetical protein
MMCLLRFVVVSKVALLKVPAALFAEPIDRIDMAAS